jgi:hypothetical protein
MNFFFVIQFNLVLRDKNLSIGKNCINEVCVEFNCAFNSEMVILYFCKPIQHSLIKYRFFFLFRITKNSSTSYSLKFIKNSIRYFQVLSA